MRNLLLPRIVTAGIITKGGFEYQEDHYYPNGGDQFMVIIYRKGRTHERGLAFRDTAHMRTWGKDLLPVQQDLFE